MALAAASGPRQRPAGARLLQLGRRTTECYLPFALNVLTLRGDQISEVDAFITRSTENPDREVLARMPEQPFEATRLAAAFENLGLPPRLT